MNSKVQYLKFDKDFGKNVFNDSLKKNYGFFIYMFIFILFLICLILFYLKFFTALKVEIYKLFESKKNLFLLKQRENL